MHWKYYPESNVPTGQVSIFAAMSKYEREWDEEEEGMGLERGEESGWERELQNGLLLLCGLKWAVLVLFSVHNVLCAQCPLCKVFSVYSAMYT